MVWIAALVSLPISFARSASKARRAIDKPPARKPVRIARMASDRSNSISVRPCSPAPAAATRAISSVACGERHGFASGASFKRRELRWRCRLVPPPRLRPRTIFTAPTAGAGWQPCGGAPVVSWSNFGDRLPPSVSFCIGLRDTRRKRLGNACGFQARLGHPQGDAAGLRARIGTHRNRHAGRYRAKTQRQNNEGNEDFEQRKAALAVERLTYMPGLNRCARSSDQPRFAGQPVDGDARRPSLKRQRDLAAGRLAVRIESAFRRCRRRARSRQPSSRQSFPAAAHAWSSAGRTGLSRRRSGTPSRYCSPSPARGPVAASLSRRGLRRRHAPPRPLVSRTTCAASTKPDDAHDHEQFDQGKAG